MAIVAARSARTRPEEDWFDLGAVGFEVQRPWLRGLWGCWPVLELLSVPRRMIANSDVRRSIKGLFMQEMFELEKPDSSQPRA